MNVRLLLHGNGEIKFAKGSKRVRRASSFHLQREEEEEEELLLL